MIQPVKEKIILGIDPGTTIMGYGILRIKGTKPEMVAMGIIDLRKFANHYLKLRHIHERVLSIIESYLHDERRYAYFHGCDRRFGGRILPFSTNGTTGIGKRI